MTLIGIAALIAAVAYASEKLHAWLVGRPARLTARIDYVITKKHGKREGYL